MQPNNEHFEQPITYARASLWVPFYTVGMVARILGEVHPAPVEAALRKLQILYPPLASRVRMEQNGLAWLTTEGTRGYSLEVRHRTSDEDWVKVFLEQEKIPFAFDRGPLARFFLLRGEQHSDLVVIAPHVVCDGYSMTHVMEDVVALMNDPDQVVTQPAAPPLVTWQSVPHAVGDNLLLRGFVRALNHIWPDSRTAMCQDSYEELHQRYWAGQENGLLVFGLSSAETADLVARCRQRSLSVTGALVAAFLLAQSEILPVRQAARRDLTIAVSIRDRLAQPPGRAVGVFASSIDLVLRPRRGISFWELARQGHAGIHAALNDRARVLRPLVLNELNPLIADELVAAISTNQWSPASRLLTRFVKITGERRCLDVSNIGRVEVSDACLPYRLENLLPYPPIVPGGRMALNVLTVNGQMNIILKYRQNELDGTLAARIKERAIDFLRG